MNGDTDTGSSSPALNKRSRRPKYSQFSQQELPANKLILTPGSIITVFVIVGVVFVPLGLTTFFSSESMVEIVDRYDDECVPAKFKDNKLAYIQDGATDKTCTRSFTVPKRMKSPVFIYYQLENFYQNHRRYVKSRSDKQLRSKDNEDDVQNCLPEAGIANKSPIVPCGLIAWSMFNDTYGFSVKGKAIQVNKKNIAWESDRKYKFGSDVYPKNFQTSGLIGGAKLNSSIPLNEQEDFLVWMRTATLSTFRKLYGKIEEDLQANDVVTVEIQNNYNTYSFQGKKSLVLSTTSWIGGKNGFMGYAYLTVGGACLFLAAAFILLYVIRPRPTWGSMLLVLEQKHKPKPNPRSTFKMN